MNNLNINRQTNVLILLLLILFLHVFIIQIASANSSEDWVNLSYSLNNGGKYAEALNASEKALEINPRNFEAWNAKGWSLRNMGKYKDALDAIDKGLEIEPHNTDLLDNKGWTYYFMGRREDSLVIFRQISAIDPNNYLPWFNTGKVEHFLGRYNDALVSFDRALSLNSNSSEIMYWKGNTLLQMGKYQAAYEAYNQSFTLDPSNKAAESSKEYLLRQFPSSILITPTSIPKDTNSIVSTSFPASNVSANISIIDTSGSTQPIPDETSYNYQVFSGLFVIIGIVSITIVLFVRRFWVKKIIHIDKAKSSIDPSIKSQSLDTPQISKILPSQLFELYSDCVFIGKGGFASVFKAKRKKDDLFVAVKIPNSFDFSTGKTFIAEMQNWTKLSHPNIVKVFDFNIMPVPYFEIELCDSSLAERKKPVDGEEAAWILFGVCEGLKYSHARKIIHRDLKPQNILLKNGLPKISDWGLSRVISESTSTTATSFTPYYAAPEQIAKKAKDERTDIWQLGVIFYELVTGSLPFTGDSIVEVMAGIATKTPQLPSSINPTSHDVEAMIMKCLEKNPNRRYQSVIELQKDLALYLRITYTESLKMSITAKDLRRSAFYCGDLIMVNLLTGDMKSAYKYLMDLVNYAEGDVKTLAKELSEQIKMRMEMGVTEIPDELIQKAEILVHKVSLSLKKT